MIYRKKSLASDSKTPAILPLATQGGIEALGNASPDWAMKISAVYGAVAYLENFVGSLPIYIYNKRTRQRLQTHDLRRTLALRPNPRMTPTDYKRFMMRNLALRGNAYAWVDRDPSSGRPVELIPLRADHVQIYTDDGILLYVYTQPKTGRQFSIDPADMLHYRWDTDDGYTGVSVLRYAADTLTVARAGQEYEQAIYRNGSRPSGILQTQSDLGGMSERKDADGNPISKKQAIRMAWEKAQGGSNAFRVAVLDNGLEYKPLSISSFDAQYIAARDFTVSDIARFFGVPLHALMSGKQAYSSNEQNSLEFIQGRGMALITMMEEEDSYKLLLDSELDEGLWIKRNLDARFRGDSAARAAFYAKMHEIGAYSVNDILEREDLPAVDGGDVHYASLNYVPLEDFRRLSAARNEGG